MLHRVGNSIDIKVQYNPDKFMLDEDSTQEETEEDEDEVISYFWVLNCSIF